jgi:hypothetical protein
LINIDAVHKSWALCGYAGQITVPNPAGDEHGFMINGLNILDFPRSPVWHRACSADLPLAINEAGQVHRRTTLQQRP